VGFFCLEIKRLAVWPGWRCPGRAPSLPSSREPAVNGPPGMSVQRLPSLSQRASQTASEASQAVLDSMSQQRRQRPSCAVLGHAGHRLHAGRRSSAYVLPKSTGHRATIMLFGCPLPPGGGGCWALARTPTPSQGIPIKSLPRLRPKGSRSSHYLDSVPRESRSSHHLVASSQSP